MEITEASDAISPEGLQYLTRRQRKKYYEGRLTGGVLLQKIAYRKALVDPTSLTHWHEVKAALLSPQEGVRDKAKRIAGPHVKELLSRRVDPSSLLSSPPVFLPPRQRQQSSAGVVSEKKKSPRISLGFTEWGEPREFDGDEGSISYIRYLGNFNHLGVVAAHLGITRGMVELLYESGLPGRVVWLEKTLEELKVLVAEHASQREERDALRLGRELAQERNLGMLAEARGAACGIGTRKLKLRLNALARSGDKVAHVLRLLLEAEDKNIVAKETHHFYRDHVYSQKSRAIQEAAPLLQEVGWRHGYSLKTGKDAMCVVYVFLPNGKQISWHMNDGWVTSEMEPIECEWDGQEATTLPKLLSFIVQKYPDINSEKPKKGLLRQKSS